MGLTKPISKRANGKQATGADFPQVPSQLVTSTYGPVSSTASQTTISLSFAVDQANKTNFLLIIDGKIWTEGSTNDYVFSSVQANNTSSQITLNQTLPAGLTVRALYLGVLQPTQAATSISTLQAQANASTALDQTFIRNYLINGSTDFFQRTGNVVNMSTSLIYQSADRWLQRQLGTWSGTPTAQSDTTRPSNMLSKNQLLLQGNATNTGAEFQIEQRIEGITACELAGQTCSFSMQMFSAMQTAIIELYVPTAEDNYASVTLVATQTVSGLALSGGYGLVTFPGLAVPSSATAGLAIRIRITNSSIIGSLANHRLTQFMFNIGSTVAPYKRAGFTLQQELALCQRYFEKSYDVNTNPGTVTNAGRFIMVTGIVGSAGGSAMQGYIPFAVNKRATPVCVDYSPSTGTVNTMDTLHPDGSVALANATQGIGGNTRAIEASVGIGTAYAGMQFQWTASAEI